jgi:hypothetical protein
MMISILNPKLTLGDLGFSNYGEKKRGYLYPRVSDYLASCVESMRVLFRQQ